MISRIEKGEAQGIIAWHPDRLARNSVDGGRIIYLLDTGHIKALKFPTFWFENTPQGKFMMNIAFGQSKYYVDNLSENVKRGNRQKLRNGWLPHQAPIGYLNDKITRTIVVDPVASPLVIKLFKTFATDMHSIREMRELAASWGLVSRRNRKKFPQSRIHKILKNSFYNGLIEYNGEFFQGKHEPLITKEIFDTVQHIFNRESRNQGRHKYDFPFLNLATCNTCGCSITAERQKGHNYYRCTKKKTKCPEPFIREEALDQQVTKMIQDVALPSEAYQQVLAYIEQDKIC